MAADRNPAPEGSVLGCGSRPRRAASLRLSDTGSRAVTWAFWVMGGYISESGGQPRNIRLEVAAC